MPMESQVLMTPMVAAVAMAPTWCLASVSSERSARSSPHYCSRCAGTRNTPSQPIGQFITASSSIAASVTRASGSLRCTTLPMPPLTPALRAVLGTAK